MDGALSRRVYLWSARLFLASVVVQVFLIGLYLFAGGSLDWHRFFSLVPTAISLILLVVTLVGRFAARSKRWTAATFIATFIQGALPSMKAALPLVAALHPVNALLMLWLGLVVLQDAKGHARLPAAASASPAMEAEAAAH